MLKAFCKEFLYEADLFKVPFVLLFQNRKMSSTILGSFLSISIIGIVAYLFFTSNMLLKTNPLVIDQTITYEHAALLEMTPNNFGIAAGVANSFGFGYSDPTIFKIQFVQIEIQFNETINTKEITSKLIKRTEPCTSSSFKDPNTFSSLGLAEYTCLQNGTFELEGGFDERVVKSLVVMISYCNNETDGVVCKTQSEINKFFQGKGLWLYYQDDIYDVSDYSKPMKKNWRLQAIQVAAVPRIIDLYLKKLIFVNDDQPFFSSEEIQYGFMKERSEGLSHFVMVDSPLISINLFSSKNNQKTKRQYQKFGDLLASIGGVINCLIIVGFFLTNLENQLQMQNYIMNTLYSFSYDKKEKLVKKKTQENEKVEKPGVKIEDICDWNKDYEEMGISRDYLAPNSNPFEKNVDKEEFKPHVEDSIKSKEESNFHDTFRNSRKQEQIPYSRTITNSFILMPAKEGSNIIKTEGHKSKFPNNLELSKIAIENSYKSFIKSNSPRHARINSPSLRPKEIALDLEKSSPHINRNFKETEENMPVSLSIAEYLKINIKRFLKKPLSTKEKLFLLSIKKFRRETDICHILEKIQEFEKFKMIFLNPDQLIIFNLLAKPLIYLENQQENFKKRTSYFLGKSIDSEFTIKNDAKRRINELKVHYKKLSEEKNLSLVDQKLLKLIENDIFANNE